MHDLTTSYLGLELAAPFLVTSCGLTQTPAQIRRLQDAGAGAVVMKSIFEEQIRSEVSDLYAALEESGTAFAQDYLRADLPMRLGPEKYLENLRAVRAAVTIPVIASVNCVRPDAWVAYARKIEAAGADALELNIYDVPVNPHEDAAAIETRHVDLVRAILAEVSIPVAVKLSPFYTSLPAFARRLDDAQVRGLVLFNRFLQPDIDIATESLKYVPDYSRAEDLRLPLRWVALLRDQLRCDLALSGGVHDAAGAVKALLAGTTVIGLCSALYSPENLEAIPRIRGGLKAWMDTKGYTTLPQFRGKMRETCLADGQGFERTHYFRTLDSVTA